MKFIEKETEQYLITFRFNPDKKRFELKVKSRTGGHSATHTRYSVLNDKGAVIGTKAITEDIGGSIIERFLSKGETEAFNIFESELNEGVLKLDAINILPGDVRHKLSRKEKAFTATGAKLRHHWPLFKKMKETGFGSIIRATMTNHQVCSSRCLYCSTISRNKKDSISLEEAKTFVKKLYLDQAEYNRANFSKYNALYKKQTGTDIRLKGLILSGGGQPNLWPHFSEFVEWLASLDIDLGLITNGFPSNISEDIYKKFKWIRLSITPEDASPFYINGQFNRQYIPASIKNNKNMTVGISYVYGSWTDDDILRRLNKACEEWGLDYCRILADCNLSRRSQLANHRDLAGRLYRLGYIDEQGNPLGRIFHQFKYHGTPVEAGKIWESGQCYLQIYNAFWDTTGHEENGYSYCYPCDSITVLSEEKSDGVVNASERRFNPEKWGTVKNIEVDKLFTEPVRPFFDPRKNCSACLFMRNNDVVKGLIKCDDYSDFESSLDIEHVNFP